MCTNLQAACQAAAPYESPTLKPIHAFDLCVAVPTDHQVENLKINHFKCTNRRSDTFATISQACSVFRGTPCFKDSRSCTAAEFANTNQALGAAFAPLPLIPLSGAVLINQCSALLKHAADPTSAAAQTACDMLASFTGCMKCGPLSMTTILKQCPLFLASPCGTLTIVPPVLNVTRERVPYSPRPPPVRCDAHLAAITLYANPITQTFVRK